MAEQELTESHFEIDISYSVEALTHKIQIYNIDPKTLYSTIKIDQSILQESLNGLSEHQFNAIKPLAEAVGNWKNHQDTHQFCIQINQLIYLWLNACQSGVHKNTILEMLRGFSFKSFFNQLNTAKLHLFLFDLVAETAHEFQQQSLNYLLQHDAVTKLPYTKTIPDDLDHVFKQVNSEEITALFCISFHTSRRQNALSKLIASDLNRHITKILKAQLIPGSRLYYGGDSQFDILIPHVSKVSQLELFAAKIARAFEEMIFLNEQSILIKPYIGCCHSQATENHNNAIYINAKLALDSAIENQQSLFFYNEHLKNQLIKQNHLELKILEAFNNDNLTLFFQPIVNLQNFKCVGAELLLRWPDGAEHHVSPSFTVETLNKVGKGQLFTRWLINSACRYSSELHHNHQLNIYLTLNLRAEDLYDIELPHMLFQATALWKVNAENIILELTENGILEYNENTNFVIKQLSEAGFKFALDDFGTGYSSLSRLRTMPIELIKIDQSFVRDIAHSKEDYEIVQSIALLAKSLGKEVLVEGIEQEDCLNMIKTMDIDKCQGYFFAKPMSFDGFIDWVKNNNSKKN